MKVIITGSRTWDNQPKLDGVLFTLLALNGPGEPFELRHGCADGADKLTQKWAGFHIAMGLPVSVIGYEVLPQEWARSRAAGLNRNVRMVAENHDANLGVAFSRGGSRGTAHCVGQMLEWGIPVWFIDYDLPVPEMPELRG